MPLTPLHEEKEDIQKDLELLHSDLERLRTAFEQHFLGLERLAPTKHRDRVMKQIQKLSGKTLQNARQKFRLQQIVARYNTFSTYWDRILKEIEEGRYGRDVFKWKIHHTDEQAPATPAVKPKPASVAVDSMLDLFNKYVSEKKKCNEDVKALTFEKFNTQMQSQMQTIKQKTGGAGVKLMVVSEGGKAKIKAVPQTVPAKKT